MDEECLKVGLSGGEQERCALPIAGLMGLPLGRGESGLPHLVRMIPDFIYSLIWYIQNAYSVNIRKFNTLYG